MIKFFKKLLGLSDSAYSDIYKKSYPSLPDLTNEPLTAQPQPTKPTEPSKRTIARRNPEIVYLVSVNSTKNYVTLKAWVADEYGRIDKTKFLGSSTVTEFQSSYTKDHWITSKETTQIRALNSTLRDAVFAFDDAIRDASK